MSNSNQVLLIYDKQCPLCENYCQMIRIREAIGELILIDARDDSDVIREITQAGLDIDQGMVLKMNHVLYYGSDAIHALSLISSRSGYFNRLNCWLFSSKWRAKLAYPVLRAIRNLLLKLMGNSKINNLQIKNNQYF